MKQKIKDSNYVTIHGWMVNQLGLTSDETFVYALIYGYKGGFGQPIAYIAQWLNASSDTARRVIQRLVAAGLLEEKKQSGKPTIYTCRPLANCNPSQVATPCNLPPHPSQIDTPHTLYIDNNYNNYIIERDSNTREEKQKKFQKPTIEEVADYCVQRKNGINAEEFYYFYESKGWLVGKTPMKNWRAAVITWEKKRNQQSNTNTQNNGHHRTSNQTSNAKHAVDLTDIAQSIAAGWVAGTNRRE